MKGQPEAEGPSEESHRRGVARIPLDGKQLRRSDQQTASKQQQTAQYRIEQTVSLIDMYT